MWNPHDLAHCVDSLPVAVYIAVTSFVAVVAYVRIAAVWYKMSLDASEDGKKAWQAMIRLFLACASAGYFASALNLILPHEGTLVRCIALAFVTFYSFRFLKYHQGALSDLGKREKLGQEVLAMSDEELSALTTSIIAERLKRRVTVND